MAEQGNFNGMAFGLCRCGCGRRTRIPPKSNRSKNEVRGVPMNYCHGHNRRASGIDYIVREDGCWVWQLHIGRDGYGQAWDPVGKRTMKAHRLSYERHKGAIPAGMHVDHVCQTPACVNPDHLEVTTPLENLRRSRHSKLSMDIAREIRRSPLRGYELAEQYGVSKAVISSIRLGRTWKEAV